MLTALVVLLGACHSAEVKTPESVSDTIEVSNCQEDTVRYTAMEQQLIDFGLVDIAEVDSTIGVEIVYATPDNFLGHVRTSTTLSRFLRWRRNLLRHNSV